MSKLTEGTTFNTYDAVKKEIEDENAKYGPPALICILRSKRRKNGLKNYYIGCTNKNCPARMVVQQKVEIDEEGVMKGIFEITACNLTHTCGRKKPGPDADIEVKVTKGAINKLAARKICM